MYPWPDAFLENMKSMLGDDFPEFIKGLSEPAPVSLRLNPLKRVEKFESCEKVPWCEEGRYLSGRPSFTFDPLFHAGCYYVQEASSMYIEQVFKQCFKVDAPLTILDLCAAPGGKSTHLSSLMPQGSILVCNELIPSRNKILRQNLFRWGSADVMVTQNESKDFLPLEGCFDLVLVDAPCSGEGLFRRDPDAAKEWSREAVVHCAHRQSLILDDAWKLLRPGGVLIYCTCTYERSENEKQIENLLLKEHASLITPEHSFEGVLQSGPGLRFYPAYIRGEGFFISALRKSEGREFVYKRTGKPKAVNRQHDITGKYIKDAENFVTYIRDQTVYAIPQNMMPLFEFMEKTLYIRHCGIRVGEIKGTDFQPSHDLALSVCLRSEVPAFDFVYEDAIKYLRCESVSCKGAPKGWMLATFENFALGWIKVIDSRVNNYFPKDWRILRSTKE
jgi:16S rRNA C967 or C1407 C5-methylase (RsmB/RsmF family)/NOL1/NOP2/fmu family ribosome biogenesis protein